MAPETLVPDTVKFAQGFLPDIISTDLSVKSVYAQGKVFSLPFIMSKYIALGMEIPEIIRRVTTNPARALGEEKELGSLMEGTCADIAILRVVDKPVEFVDFAGDSIHGEKLFRTEMTIREGQTAFRLVYLFIASIRSAVYSSAASRKRLGSRPQRSRIRLR